MGTGEAAKEYGAGFAAGLSMVITGHPFDTIKVKLQAHNTTTNQKLYKNALHCASRILINEGIRGLYRGASSSFIGMSIESSVFFGTYSLMKSFFQGTNVDGQPQLQVILPSAGCSGALISGILCPTELVKCRMQVQGKINTGSKYKGPLDCALKTLQSEGVRGIFRGGVPTLMREAIGNSVFFGSYEFSRYWMHLRMASIPGIEKNRILNDIGIGIVSGGFSGIAFWTAVMPIDVAKTIIQTTPDMNSSRNPFQVISLVYRKSGLRGCYAGLGPTLARAFPANAAAIVTWEFTAKLLGIRHE
ncbi:mitochondrial substrate carrier family protein isoform X1 [Carex rostrata]